MPQVISDSDDFDDFDDFDELDLDVLDVLDECSQEIISIEDLKDLLGTESANAIIRASASGRYKESVFDDPENY